MCGTEDQTTVQQEQEWHMTYASWALKQRYESFQAVKEFTDSGLLQRLRIAPTKQDSTERIFLKPASGRPGRIRYRILLPSGSHQVILISCTDSLRLFFLFTLWQNLCLTCNSTELAVKASNVLCSLVPRSKTHSQKQSNTVDKFLSNIVLALALDKLETSQLSIDYV